MITRVWSNQNIEIHLFCFKCHRTDYALRSIEELDQHLPRKMSANGQMCAVMTIGCKKCRTTFKAGIYLEDYATGYNEDYYCGRELEIYIASE